MYFYTLCGGCFHWGISFLKIVTVALRLVFPICPHHLQFFRTICGERLLSFLCVVCCVSHFD